MSYIRFSSKYTYVEGESKDYIYPARNSPKGKIRIVDCSGITNETLVELFCRYAEIKDGILPDAPLKEYLIKNLAKKLNVKLKKVK